VRIKLDENIPTGVKDLLPSHDVHSVFDEGLAGSEDLVLWEVAQAEGRFLITQDLDFSDLRRFLPGSHAGILLIRLKSPSLEFLMTRIKEVIPQTLEDWKGCFVVATESKIRVRAANRQPPH